MPTAPLLLRGRRSALRRLADGKVAAVSHGQYVPTPTSAGEQSGLVTLTFDLLTLKVVSESRVTWATSVPILVFLGLSVLDLGLMYARDRQTDRQTNVRKRHCLMPHLLGTGHNKLDVSVCMLSSQIE